MKALRMLARAIRDACKSVVRNFPLSLASISCITITLIIVASALIISYNVENFTKAIEKDMTIVAFLNNKADEDAVKQAEKEIDHISNVSKITFHSRQEIKEKMQKESDVFNAVLEGWEHDESPLKENFQIKVKDITQIKATAEQIKKIDNIDVVRYGEGMVEKMVQAFSSIQKITYAIAIALVIVTMLLIVNTIKLTITYRNKEIGIMRVVGASNTSIRVPFIIEGMILGILGSIVPICFVVYGYSAIYSHFDGHLYSQLIRLVPPEPFIYQVSLIVLGIGILVGMFGSAGAVRKYLKI